ncbi:dual specificity protein phosphatase 5 [Tachysurus fulvidraco]|uniref:dual specificity protein phosphatase 5 n=1 Tax=Tachysurus fulvidraco TaxID=1234273 RepID=UPI000F514A3E|nr:dual specificity protein phosphatase 5 [Tachysurus fulvidraco]
MIMKVSSIDSRHFKKILRKETGKCLILDCRPYLSFSSSSVRGSVNVNLNSVVLRRSRGAPVPLRFVVPDEHALYRLREGGVSVVVALDENTPHLHKLKKDSVARLAIHSLAHLSSCANICFLKGGYESFQAHYPELCTEAKAPLERSVPDTEVYPGTDYTQDGPVELLPFLYLGSAHHARRHDCLSELRITALLNVSRRDWQCAGGPQRYKRIAVEDSHTADIGSHFQEAIDFIDEVKREGGKVLVHCEAGISRSPTICMAYLMKTQRLRLEEAFDAVRQRRAVISPNFSFMGQLLQFENEVLASVPDSNMENSNDQQKSDEFTIDKSFESSVFSFPTSFLSPIKLNPITSLTT